jgi:predicted phage tail protein
MIFRGSKGAAASPPPTRTPDNLRSKDTVEVILALSEGPINGLKGGTAKTFFLGDTPLVNTSDEQNFGDFELLFYPGHGVSEHIRPALGGTANNNSVGVRLDHSTPVVRTGGTANVDAIELRLVINQLYKAKENGDQLMNTLNLLVEYKPSSEPDWRRAYLLLNGTTPANIGAPDSNFIRYSGAEYLPLPGGMGNFFDYDVTGGYEGPAAPSYPRGGDVFVDRSASLAAIRQWDGNTWQTLGTQALEGEDFSFTYVDHEVLVYDNPPASVAPPLIPPGSSTAPSALIIGRPGSDIPRVGRGLVWGLLYELSEQRLLSGDDPYGASTHSNLILTGKTTSPYVKELRIQVERIAEPYDIRITKNSIDIGEGGDDENFIDVTWESFQEVIAGDVEYDNVACIQLVGQATDQLSGIPAFSGIWEGMLIRIPSNYDPVARTYDESSPWDGTWNIAYTNNPVFIWNEFKLNTLWGQSATDPVTPNKWDVYAAGKFCDEMVDDGEGGTQPRYTFNEWITTPQSVQELGVFIAGVFGGVSADDGIGGVFLRYDHDTPAVGLITPEMCHESTIIYSRTDIDTRVNDITVAFKDPILGYEENRLRVVDEAHVARYGRKPFPMVAIGCRNRQEAIRRARQRLITSTTEVTTATLMLTRLIWAYDLYDIILLADPALGTGLPGRVKSFLNANKTSWELRDPVTLEVGVAYSITLQVKNPGYGLGPDDETNVFDTIEIPLTGAHPTGAVTQLDLDWPTALDLPAHAPFAVTADGYAGVPKPFRILGYASGDGDIDAVSVTLLEVNRSKQTFIDTGESLEAQVYSALASAPLLPPVAVRAMVSQVRRGGVLRDSISLYWDRPSTDVAISYIVRYSIDGSPYQDYTKTSDTMVEFSSVEVADYTFQVTTVSLIGGSIKESRPAYTTFQMVGSLAPVETPLGLRVENGTSDTVFASPDAVLIWG